jgi:two-component system response regulator FlrC
LARYFLSRHGERLKRAARLGADAERLILSHAWPGNVRELENATQRALILAGGETITEDTMRLCLPAGVRVISTSDSEEPSAAFQSPMPSAVGHGVGKHAENLAASPASSAGAESSRPVNMKDLEREHILATLKEVAGSRKRAVEKLGISERTLRYKLQQYREEGHDV